MPGRAHEWALATSDAQIFEASLEESSVDPYHDYNPILVNIPLIMRPQRVYSKSKKRKPQLNAEKITIDCNLFPTSATSNGSSALRTVAYGAEKRLATKSSLHTREFFDL